MISVIYPSRGRPEMAKKTALKWISRSVYPFEYIISIDQSDIRKSEYDSMPGDKLLCFPNKNAVQAINVAAKRCKGDIIVVISDDFDCPERWDELLVKEVEGKKDWILKTQDGIQNWMITLPIMDRAYYERFGYVYHPDYEHMFCDTHMTCVADLLGRKLTSSLLFKHNHYKLLRMPADETSKKADETWNSGEETILNFARNNFGLSEDQIIGKITDLKTIDWFKRKGVIIG